MTFATKKGSQRYSKQKNMLTPELNISANFTTADRISSETLWAYCAELKKTKAVIFALCIRGRVKAMINLVQYNIGPGTMIASIFPVLMSKSTSPTKPRRLQSFTFITSRCLSSQIRIDINLPDPSVIKICTKGPGGSSWTGISIYFYFVTSDNVTLSKCSV